MNGAIPASAHVRRALLAAVAIVMAAALVSAPGASAALPKGFEAQQTITGLTTATGVAYAPDGRAFVVEKGGVLKVAPKGSKTATTLLDIRDHVNHAADRGLLGVAVDKDFASNGYVYILYTYDFGMVDDLDGPQTSRLSRITVLPNNTLANPGNPETVLLGSVVGAGCPTLSNTVDCIPSEGLSHSIGSVRVDPTDGTLFVGSGDASDFGAVDEAALGTYDEQTYRGKILHIDRNGNGLPVHSFCPGQTNLALVCTKLYAKGFRNPFRFQLRPGGGLAVGDVGWNTWEEVDLIDGPGGNYGWPCYEANTKTPGYKDQAGCDSLYANEGGPNAAIAPDYAYDRSTGGSAVVGGPTYVGNQYPAGYQDSIFIGDYTGNFVKRLILKPNGDVDHVEAFATDWIGTALELAPSGNLAAVNYGTGAPGDGFVEEYVYTPGNSTPVPTVKATPTTGAAPLKVAFSSAGTTDPDGDALAYSWDFGDGGSSTAANPEHTYTQPGSFTATLTVDDGRGKTASKSLTITPGGDAPVVQILTPTAGSPYRDGSVVGLQGSATDKQDGALGGASLTWIVRLIHGSHFHPLATLTGTEASFNAATDHDADSHYEIRLIATDSGGLTNEKTIEIHPETIPLTIESVPAGAPISYGGRAFFTNTTQTTAIGYDTTLSAAKRFGVGGRRYQFASWSDGGAQLHALKVPDHACTVRASYAEDYAAGGVASASGVEGAGLDAAQVLDDSSLTRWSSTVTANPWWQVDLGAVKDVRGVEVDWEAAYAAGYRILTSADGASFAEAATASASGAGTVATPVPAVQARYVRIEATTKANPAWGISAYDIRVLGPALDAGTPPACAPEVGPPPPGMPEPPDQPPPTVPKPPTPKDTTRPTVKEPKIVKRRGRAPVLTFRLSERATVRVRLNRSARRTWKPVKTLVKQTPKGAVRITMPKTLGAGLYRVTVSATDVAGNPLKKPVTVRFRIGG